MNWKATLAMLAIAVAIAWFYFQDVEKVEQEKQAEKQKEELVLVEKEDIMALSIERPGKGAIAAVRDGEEWTLTEPVSWPADKFAWDAVTSSLATAKIRRTFPDEGETLSEEDLGNWGLNPPEVSISATIREGSKEIEFGLGRSLPGADSSVYATSSDLPGMVVVVPKALITNASKELYALRERKYLNVHFDRDEPSRIEVSNKDIQLVSEKVEGDSWKITSPEKVKGDPSTLRKYVEKIGLESIKIVDDADDAKLTEFGLADDQIASATRYKVGFGESGDSMTFYIGKFDPSEGGHYGRREGTRNLFLVSGDFFDGQPTTLEELRPKKAIFMQKWSADVVSATSNGEPLFHLVKEDFKWRMTSPHSATAEREVVDRLLDAFNDYKIVSFVNSPAPDSELGLEVPILSLTLQGEKGTEAVHFGNPDGVGGIYAAWEGLPDRFTIDQGILERVLLNPLDLLIPDERDRVSPSKAPPEEEVGGEPELLDLTEETAPTEADSEPSDPVEVTEESESIEPIDPVEPVGVEEEAVETVEESAPDTGSEEEAAPSGDE